jgi:hypothetical protein
VDEQSNHGDRIIGHLRAERKPTIMLRRKLM